MLTRERIVQKNIHIPVTWSPFFTGNGYLAVYKIDVSARVGLPPFAQFKILRRLIREVEKYALSPRFWISVDTPGPWFLNELKRLFSDTWCYVTILESGRKPRKEDFQNGEHGFNALAFPPPFRTGDRPGRFSMTPREFRVLQSLARARLAAAIELSSLSGITNSYTRALTQQLCQKNLIRRKKNGKYDAWEITRNGIQEVYRSWKTIQGFNTKSIVGEQNRAGWRHRRVSRLWAMTLKTSWGSSVRIWESWAEVNLGGAYPDSIAWGTYDGKEVLFWLEVESGKRSHDRMQKKYQWKFNKAKQYARICGLSIIFTVLGCPWTLVSIAPHLITDIPANMALILHPWMELDNLPFPRFGACSPQFMDAYMNYHPNKRTRRYTDSLLYPMIKGKKTNIYSKKVETS